MKGLIGILWKEELVWSQLEGVVLNSGNVSEAGSHIRRWPWHSSKS